MEAAAHALRTCAPSAPKVPVATEREIPQAAVGIVSKGATLPLGMPLRVATGGGGALNRTLPLAIRNPATSPPFAPSGAYASNPPAPAAAHQAAPPAKGPSWVPIAGVALVAAAAGGIAAWLW